METRPIGKGSVIVTDDAAELVGRRVPGTRDVIYAPSPLPDTSGITFSKEQKQAALDLLKLDHTGK